MSRFVLDDEPQAPSGRFVLDAPPQKKVYGNPTASRSEAEKMRREFVAKEGTVTVNTRASQLGKGAAMTAQEAGKYAADRAAFALEGGSSGDSAARWRMPPRQGERQTPQLVVSPDMRFPMPSRSNAPTPTHVSGDMDATPEEADKLRREFLNKEGTVATRAKEGAKAVLKDAEPYYRPLLEGGGAAIGGIVGAGGGTVAAPGPGTLAGGVAGGALGYAMGKNVADTLSGDWAETPQDATVRSLKDIATGATYEMGGQAAGAAIGAAIRKAPAIVNAVRHPIQSTAENRAKQVLTSLADLAPQEAANAAKGEQLTSRLGVKLTPAQMTAKPATAAMEHGLATADPAFSAALTAQDNAAKDVALGRIRQAIGGETALPAQQGLDDVGEGITNAIKAAQQKAKPVHTALYEDIPNVTLSTDKIAAAVNDLKAGFRPGDEAVYPSRAISRVEAAIQTHHQPNPETTQFMEELTGNIYTPTPKTVGFQDLHALRKDIGRQITDATSGPSPNRELASKLQTLKGAIDDTIELNMGANDKYQAAKSAFQDYANTFRTGAVNKTLQRGKEATGLRLADETIPRQFYTPSGADGLIKAVGKGPAKEQMKPYMVADMLKAAAPDGVTYNVQTGIKYIQKNRVVLEKLGLVDEARQILKEQMPAEIERMIAKRAPDAVTGKQYLTSQDMRTILQKYGNTIKQLHGPDALQSFRDYNQLMGMIDRKNVVPRGGNSNTAEKAMNLANLMIKEATGPAKKLTDGMVGAMAQGAGIGTGASLAGGHMSGNTAALGAAVMAGRQMLKNADSQMAKAFVKILQDATLDPSIARDLMSLQRTGKVPATLQTIIDNNLIAATALSQTEDK